MLLFTIFCSVSGGPFGLEQLVSASGAGFAILLILIIPVVWALPDSLMSAEMASALPVEGGYVYWVRRTMGPFWAFLNAWWTWIYSLVDAAMYPVLFAKYFTVFAHDFLGVRWFESHPNGQWFVALSVIILFTWLNVRGTRLVGLTSVGLAWVLILPFVAMVAVGAFRLVSGHPMPSVAFLPQDKGLAEALKDGLAVVMWNYLGWDVLSTVAEEVEAPEKAYPKAILFGLPLVTALYLLAVAVGLPFVSSIAAWQEGSWPMIARETAGPWIGFAVSVAGMASPVALFTASLLGSSRVPFVLAEDGFLPKSLMAIHPRFGTPWRAILVCGLVYAVLSQNTFQDLVQVNVMLYGAALVLECLSLVFLRIQEPDLKRPFKVGGGWFGLSALVVLPIIMMTLLVVCEGLEGLRFTILAVASGPALYLGQWLWRRQK